MAARKGPCRAVPSKHCLKLQSAGWSLIGPRRLSWNYELSWRKSYDGTDQTQHDSSGSAQIIQNVRRQAACLVQRTDEGLRTQAEQESGRAGHTPAAPRRTDQGANETETKTHVKSLETLTFSDHARYAGAPPADVHPSFEVVMRLLTLRMQELIHAPA